MEPQVVCERLAGYGVLAVRGADARSFLHAQLTADVANLAAGRAALAGWCSAKGRLLASFLVVPRDDGFLLQLARNLAAPVAKRLGMFVLRAKAKVSDESDLWVQYGYRGPEAAPKLAAAGLPAPGAPFEHAQSDAVSLICTGDARWLLLAPAQADPAARVGLAATDHGFWQLDEIRAGRPLIEAATQDLFVPQMVNYEALGGVDFRKGCYPGQEVVARAQYRGQVKRRMVRARVQGELELSPGLELYGAERADEAAGTVVNAARTAEGWELLAVASSAALEQGSLRAGRSGPPLEMLPLPYPA